MAIVLGEVEGRSRGKTRPDPRDRDRGGARAPSIREICLVGLVGAVAGVGPAPEQAPPSSGRRVTRSGRAYRVEATQVREGGDGGPLRYVHLSALAEA